jgi:Holliday junction DNA helicase RuvA
LIAYIKGKLISCTPTSALIEQNQSIGMLIEISLNTYEKIKDLSDVMLHTHLHLKKDVQTLSAFELFGFFDLEEKVMFEHLISVSGIGTNTARVMLSSMNGGEIRGAILTDNESKISSIKGIGPKTAKRLILELKDKMLKGGEDAIFETKSNNKIKEEALIALTSLGFQKNTIQKALASIEKQHAAIETVEEYIKLALKIL